MSEYFSQCDDNECFYICVIAAFVYCLFFFFKQKTAYEMRISDWSSDVCSSDLFKALANDILEEKGKRFAELSQSNLGKLLGPFNDKLTEFRTRVDTIYGEDKSERGALSEQVRQLQLLNQTLSQDARNLTSELKGSSKTQGNQTGRAHG